MISRDIEVFFSEFDEIYENRHKYSIEWAYENAQGKLDSFRDELINTRLKKKCCFCNSKKRIDDDFKSLQKSSHMALKKQKWYSRVFSNMYSILTFIEMILSVILVLTISKLSHAGEAMLHTEILSFWVAITFAFMKVFIERYLLKPKLEALGWRFYLNSVKLIKNMIKEFNDKATEDLMHFADDKVLEII
ncbi:MAG: hypothetical protein N4A62_20390 [Marinisporobacter sp.]|jgi:hypothetical protein|nr:hypothetical protein [Marinisporobacter sp.]